MQMQYWILHNWTYIKQHYIIINIIKVRGISYDKYLSYYTIRLKIIFIYMYIYIYKMGKSKSNFINKIYKYLYIYVRV